MASAGAAAHIFTDKQSTILTAFPLHLQLKVLTVSLAYFTYDSICCELIKHDWPNFLHHLATIAGLVVGVLQLKSGPELTVCLVLMVRGDSRRWLAFEMQQCIAQLITDSSSYTGDVEPLPAQQGALQGLFCQAPMLPVAGAA